MSFARRHLPALLFAAAVLFVAGPWGSSSNTGSVVEPFFRRLGLPPDLAMALHHVVRKAGHVAAYAVFGVLAWRSTRGTGPVTSRAAFLALAYAVLLAAADEAVQALTPSRGGRVADAAFDVGGAALGVACALAWAKRRAARGLDGSASVSA